MKAFKKQTFILHDINFDSQRRARPERHQRVSRQTGLNLDSAVDCVYPVY